ncbi:MAG: HD domain-containing protein, partial [Deltaproteobacteria bacterium]|nr:HD domain-containing protein [Deltaproteobacteria bacterium]
MLVPLNELLYPLSRALDFVEQELLGVMTNHGKRAAYVSARICKAMGLDDAQVCDMACCAILHDNALTSYMLEAGPDGIGGFERFESHCARGEENVRDFPFAGDTDGIILHHHENWDGSGFHKLAGSDIPLRALALRLADNMDLHLKMGDGRAGLALEIRRHAGDLRGTVYAPRIVEALNDILTPDFLRDMADDSIDAALNRIVPPVQTRMSNAQMLMVCNIFAMIIDAKSPFTRNHSTGVVRNITKLAEIFGMDEKRKERLMIAGYLHDLGKLATPLSILEKPGPLSEDEFGVMRDHVAVTQELLAPVEGLEDIARWASQHHEELRGNGYRAGLTATALPVESRGLAGCDSYQAL